MGEMKRYVVENYPAGKLPNDVRKDIDPENLVDVTVQEASKPESTERRFERFRGIAAHRNTSIEEAVARVRVLRDEWD